MFEIEQSSCFKSSVDCMHVPFAFSGIRMSLKEISALLAVWPFLPYVSERNICIVGRLAVSFSVEKETGSRPVPSSFTEYSP